MFGTYKEQDVIVLLTDISGKVKPLGTEEREKRIQNGTHYSEMLPLEYQPSEAYLQTYYDGVKRYARKTAEAVSIVAEKIWEEKCEKATLVSLARAGTSIGVLIKRYILFKYHKDISHYTISIIRGKGIDKNAMNYILDRHNAEDIQFVDGWTGKGAIQRELDEAVKDFPGVSSGLAVLSDPAHLAEKYGTREDFLIASSCLNSTVSGLLSRTFYRKDIIKEHEFHGALFYKELLDQDLTYQFISSVEQYFAEINTVQNYEKQCKKSALEEVECICRDFGISDINKVKPSIGETTRVLLRRMPWKILVHSLQDEEHLGQIYQLAREKGVQIMEYPLENYKACGLIQTLADN